MFDCSSCRLRLIKNERTYSAIAPPYVYQTQLQILMPLIHLSGSSSGQMSVSQQQHTETKIKESDSGEKWRNRDWRRWVSNYQTRCPAENQRNEIDWLFGCHNLFTFLKIVLAKITMIPKTESRILQLHVFLTPICYIRREKPHRQGLKVHFIRHSRFYPGSGAPSLLPPTFLYLYKLLTATIFWL